MQMRHPFYRLHRSALCACLLAAVGAPAAVERIYAFVDEAGVTHLSNVPADPRYQLTAQTAPGETAQVAEVIAETQPAPEDDAPAGEPRFVPVHIQYTPPPSTD